jgi:hypothetical protein
VWGVTQWNIVQGYSECATSVITRVFLFRLTGIHEQQNTEKEIGLFH